MGFVSKCILQISGRAISRSKEILKSANFIREVTANCFRFDIT